MAHAVEVAALVVEGGREAGDERSGPVLRAWWSWAPALFDGGEVEQLARRWVDALTDLAALATRAPTGPGQPGGPRPGLPAGGYLPFDFPLVPLSQAEVDELADRVPGLVDVLPMAPLQEGLLFHALYDDDGGRDTPGPGTSDVYTLQLALDLAGAVDPARLRQALESVVARHPALRAAFLTGLDSMGERPEAASHGPGLRAVQVIAGAVTLPWREFDLAGLPAAEREAQAERIARAQRAERFDLSRPPLLRAALLRLGYGEARGDRLRLLLTHHHILLDGWSLPLLLEDLLRAYAGTGPETPARPHRDYVAWRAGRDREAARRAWEQALAGITGPTLLAAAAAPAGTAAAPAVAAVAAVSAAPAAAPGVLPGQVHIDVPPGLALRLRTWSRAQGRTFGTLVQGAWALVLARVTGRSDVVFGTTVSGRPAELDGVESMIGLFVNTVPVRVRTSAADTPAQLLGRLQEEQVRLLDHHHLELPEILRLTGAPQLFDTLVVVENYPLGEATDRARAAAGLRVTDVLIRDATHYPLTVVAFAHGGALRLRLDHALPLVDRATATVLGERLLAVLTAIVDGPDLPLAGIDALTPAERRRILGDWNRPSTDGGPGSGTLADRLARGPRLPGGAVPANVPEVFAARLHAAPDAVALRSGGTTYTYAEVDRWAARLTSRVTAAGVRPGDRVGLLLERGPAMVVAMLAVLRAGAAYVPVDGRLPAGRQRVLLTVTGARVLLVDGTTDAGPLTDLAVPLPVPPTALGSDGAWDVDVDGDGDGACADDRARDGAPGSELPGIGLDSAAYVMFTSGSTGVPKGVEITQRGVLSLALDQRWVLGPGERVLVHSPYSFDPSTYEVWMPLLGGGQLVFGPPGEPDVDALAAVIREHGVTSALLTAGLFRIVAEEDPLALAGVREVLTGGDVVSAASVRRVLDHCPDTLVTDIYGPTEITLFATQHPMRAGDDVPASVPIGRARQGMRAYVLDDALRPVPPGTVGDLYIAGDALARGYVAAPGLTATRFVADPFADLLGDLGAAGGDRMYRTGDLARWTSDGTLVFAGRADEQIKIRGYRIEPGEVEAALAAHPDVTDALVAPLVGPAVGADESFFALGGDSVLSIQLVSRARRAGLLFSARDVFERRTPAGLAAVARPAAAGNRPAGSAARADDATGDVPLTPVMHWLRELVRGLPDGPAGGTDAGPLAGFAQSVLLRVPAGLGEERLGRAVRILADHHDMLRARLIQNGGWHLHVPARGSAAGAGAGEAAGAGADAGAGAGEELTPVSRVDVTGRSPAEVTETVRAWLAAATADLSPLTGRMLRVVWFDAGDAAGLLLLVVHHLAVDGVSWRILLPDLHEAWELDPAGPTPSPGSLAPVGCSFRAWARQLVARATTPDVLAELPYWWGVLSRGVPLVAGRPDPLRDTWATSGRYAVSLPTEVSRSLLVEVAPRLRCGMEELLLGALAVALDGWSAAGPGTAAAPETGAGPEAAEGSGGVLVEVERHGRDEGADLSRTVGWFTALFPVLVEVGGVGVVGAVRRVREMLRGVPGDGSGYGLLRYVNGQSGAVLAGAGAGAGVGFNYLGRSDVGVGVGAEPGAGGWSMTGDVDLSGAGGGGLPLAHAVEIGALVVEDAAANGPVLTASWSWAPSLVGADEIRDLADRWVRALTDLADPVLRDGPVPADEVEPGPADLRRDVPLVALTAAGLADLRARVPGLADVLPLAPLQEGLLFHALYEAGNGGPRSGDGADGGGAADAKAPGAGEGGGEGGGTPHVDPYTAQLVVDLAVPVDPGRLRGAFEAVLARHPALRAAFLTGVPGVTGDEDGSRWAVQVIAGTVELPWREVDLAGRPEPEHAAARIAAAERSAGFDLVRPPLMRVALLHLPAGSAPADKAPAGSAPEGGAGAIRARVVLTHHHLLLDGWSMPLLVRDLLDAYESGGRLAPSAASYRDHLVWLAGRDRAAARAAWAAELAGLAEPCLVAPGAPEIAPVAPAHHEVELPAELGDAMRRFARDHDLTLNTVVQGAWALLLARLTGRADVVFGATVSGRPAELDGVESVIGLFINTVPVRVRVDPAEPAASLLSGLQQAQARLLDHQHLGLGEITRLAGLPRLFDTLVVFENYPLDEAPADPRLVAVTGHDATHYPLTLVVLPARRPRLRLGYRPDAVGADLAEAIGRWLTRLLTDLTDVPRHGGAPGRLAGSFDLLDEKERHRVLVEWNDTAVTLPAATLTDLLDAQIARTPDAEAVVFEGTRLRYAELDARVTAVAAYLRARGVGPEHRVAVVIPRSDGLVVAVLAVLRAGAAYVPVDPGYPAERVATILLDAAPTWILTSAQLRAAEASGAGDLTGAPGARAGGGSRRLDPRHPAYLIYTSGSTGEPKAVTTSHEAIVNRLRWMQATYPLSPGARVLHKTPATFDVSVWELFWPLIAGATVVVARPDGHRDPGYLADLVATERIDTAHFVPSMLEVYLDEIARPGRDGPAAAPRRVLCSGEALPGELVRRFHEVLGDPPAGGSGGSGRTELHNLYGPTEAAVDVTAWPCPPETPRTVAGTTGMTGTVPIGRPVWNTRLHILDAALRPVPPGVPGELYLAGTQLARGYHGQPAVTAARFVATPFGPPGSRMYRTGDRARWRADGAVEFLGRVDDQLKIRGVRVEPAEIEHVLAAHPGVARAAVAAQPGPGGTRLVACVVPVPGVPADVGDLRAHVARALPEHCVPSVVVMVDDLPRTANGKLDRRALVALAAAGPAAHQPELPVAPDPSPGTPAVASHRARALADLFAQVLGLPEVGPQDGFFDRGGHSLLAMRLVGRIRDELGLVTGIRDLLAAPSPTALAQRLADQHPAPHRRLEGAFDPVLPLRAGGGNPPLFCVHPSSGLSWAYTGLLPGLDRRQPVYGLQAPALAALGAPIGAGAGPAAGPAGVGASVGELARRHLSALRTVSPGGPYRLLGWSFGGVVAYEMAVRLQQAGEQVELLVLLDAYPPAGATAAESEPTAEPTAGPVAGAGRRVPEELREHAALARLDEAALDRLAAVSAEHERALAGFAPGRFDGDLVLFTAGQDRRPGATGTAAWAGHVTGRVVEYPLPCTHHEMLRPEPAAAISAVLAELLAPADPADPADRVTETGFRSRGSSDGEGADR
ncbi:amino acid adenylation domain-containing protein [Parafrankia sp. FMc2]|uniref:amino acid adenylation domain-containing protein n=1 Tax=Parafrankia sp. FMc2 TaxID=3233196 RepID=UPI0034D5DF08